ncbi:hypothetical protein RUM_20690 [Ruminococcus champanellensis 18P13 = JCM 17042]|uniref:Uncharacterized protein n=1 Tax=Ruminococcus champanellensis (strain DSM 18848 / JCM 17042 / KCTC 15320 / 18P13) TaxID=213810 RepID=D4LEP7_RUMC1|nr:hypothetical protein RUM_20690 [Ruminococcus champanellensis 18P13 = JCM 17042]
MILLLRCLAPTGSSLLHRTQNRIPFTAFVPQILCGYY